MTIEPNALAVRNPLPAHGGVDMEDAAVVRRRAPEAFRRQERAVTPADYAAVTERLPAVQRAAATLRWTGSWHTVFVTVDRVGGVPMDAGFEDTLTRHVDRYRMAGHDLEFNDPVHVSLELDLLVCVAATHFRADVHAGLLEVLSNRVLADGRRGLFHPDNFSFGQTVYLSPIYAAARQVAGVASVQVTLFQRQGTPDPVPLAERPHAARAARDRAPRQRSQLSRARRAAARALRRQVMSAGPVVSHPATCGCCAGVDVETPARIDNPPGQSAIAYRTGAHARFKESLLARLSAADLPALHRLGTRDDADFTIALCDSAAVMLDVLGFYQERIANEHFLRTATERRSILELARLIGYELAPGVAAGTHLAFTLQEAPGDPAAAAEPVAIPAGTRVQSVPGPGEQPQTFETAEAVTGRVEWNAIPVQSEVAWKPQFADTALDLAGVGNNVNPGDVLLVVGKERIDDPASNRWDIRLVTRVELDVPAQRTRVHWTNGLGSFVPPVLPAAAGATVYIFRTRAALFGHNAPDPRLMVDSEDTQLDLLTDNTFAGRVWSSFSIQGLLIDLDAAYPKVGPGSWFALVSNDATPDRSGLQGPVQLYGASKVGYPSRTDFGLGGKVTRIEPDTSTNLDTFRHRLRQTLVLAQSDALPVAPRRLDFPHYGATLPLGRIAEGLAPRQAIAVTGKRARVRLRKGASPVTFALAAGGTATLEEGDSLRLAGTPELKFGTKFYALPPLYFALFVDFFGLFELRLRLLDRDGAEGTAVVAGAAIERVPAEEKDEAVSEIAFVANLPTAVVHDRDRTTLTLAAPLAHVYDRPATSVNANVAHATHGETVNEILGSGDARQPNARFALRQSPLTHVSAPTPSGRRAELAVRANDLLWTEVPSLYARGPTERLYEVRIDDDARASVLFGDGVEGARLPSGDHNVRATYRKGLGLAGNVAPGKLTNLLSRPLGVTGASNPEPATGGEDPETTDRARTNAPLTVLTLDRAVSIRDYEDFARAFAGIAKAHALWIPSGPARGVFLTVAGELGAAVPETSDTFANLQEALRLYGDPLMPLVLKSYRDGASACARRSRWRRTTTPHSCCRRSRRACAQRSASRRAASARACRSTR